MRLAIVTPVQSLVTPEYAHSLAWTMSFLTGSPDTPVEQVWHYWIDGAIIHGIRSDLAEKALELGATHILWNDADMKFEPKNVTALLTHSDLDIVGCNYVRRLPPYENVAIDLNGHYIKVGQGLEEVLYCGMGLMLTKASVFERLPKPWFFQPWDPEKDDTVGEDVWFCRLARDHDIKTWVDHDASIGVGHVGKAVLEVERPTAESAKLRLVQ